METKTGILLTLIIFYSIVSVLIGFIGASISEDVGEQTKADDSRFNLFSNIITGYSSFPTWINITIFTPFVLIISWIILSSLPTMNGGA